MAKLDFQTFSHPYTVNQSEVTDLLFPARTTAQLADADDAINVRPDKFAGKAVWDTTLGEMVYASGAAPADGWVRAGGDVAATAADIADKTATINTVGKYIGKTVYDVTNGLLYAADDVADVDTWTLIDGVGSTQVTPA